MEEIRDYEDFNESVEVNETPEISEEVPVCETEEVVTENGVNGKTVAIGAFAGATIIGLASYFIFADSVKLFFLNTRIKIEERKEKKAHDKQINLKAKKAEIEGEEVEEE